ncbi:FHA domain-containing protein [Actinomadura gamaensis]|uniref:FHA domain-containing protein n=1 Tax=Actinomadura gamaensis TaxID=1763541 RepID=A0ABV9TS83_9ACTN
MALCPAGHASGSDDYCDVCGERIGGTSAPPAPGAPPSGPRPAAPGAPTQAMVAPGVACPDCGTPAADRFCEQCGYDFATGGGRPSAPPVPQPARSEPSEPMRAPDLHYRDQSQSGPRPAGWVAVVSADRAYYDAVIAMNGPDAARIVFPPFVPERRIPLTGDRVLIGRRSPSRGTEPQIDLRQPPEDPGVSHTHAFLLARPDGRWSLVDPGSANGTCVNDSIEPIPNNVEVPVGEGDRVHVGAWTTITLTRGGTP